MHQGGSDTLRPRTICAETAGARRLALIRLWSLGTIWKARMALKLLVIWKKSWGVVVSIGGFTPDDGVVEHAGLPRKGRLL